MARLIVPEQHRQMVETMDWIITLTQREFTVVEPLARWLKDGGHGYYDIPPGIRTEVFFKDFDTGEIHACAQWREWGWDERDMENLSWMEKVHPDDRDSLNGFSDRIQESNGIGITQALYRVRDSGGVYHWTLSSSAAILWEKGGGLYRYVGRDVDIGSRIERELGLRDNLRLVEERSARERALLEAASRISGVTSREELAAAVEESVPAILGMDVFRLVAVDGMDVRCLLGRPLPDELDPRRMVSELTGFRGAGLECASLQMSSGNHLVFDLGNIPEGRALAILRSTASCADEADRIMSVLGPIILRAMERVSGLDELRRHATTDLLTGAWNRRPFLDQAGRRLRRSLEDLSCATLVMLDIDRFKTVNDTYGHPRGDSVLASVAAGMSGTLRTRDLMCRWGGEEFAIYLDGTCGEDARNAVERIRAAASRHGSDAMMEFGARITLSAGYLVVSSDDPCTLSDALALADDALLRAKREGRDRACRAEILTSGENAAVAN